MEALGVDLYRRVHGRAGNLAFSPASIAMALSMTFAGARGETAEEMATALHFGPAVHDASHDLLQLWRQPTEGVTLDVRNQLFGQASYPFEAPFLAQLRELYAAPLERVDFTGAPEAQRVHINAWVSTHTERRIPELLPPGSITDFTKLTLVNTVYFLGEWADRFDPQRTRDAPFGAPGRIVEVPMMSRVGEARYGETVDATVLELTYRGGAFAMVFVLPRARDGLPAIEGTLSVERIASWMAALRSGDVDMRVPRFTITASRLDLGALLLDQGVERAFSPTLADFSGMTPLPANEDTPRLHISAAFHEAFVAVDERGTEAAAATAVVMGDEGAAMPARFFADHPFLFFIRDTRVNTTLFMGRVVEL